MALQLPPLAALRLFESAGRHESFKIAAEELHLTPSAVSHGIVSLERWLGVRLFERRNNGVVLTDAGRDYLPFVSEALATIAVGTRRVPSTRGIHRVSVSVAPTFAARWLLPRLPEFRELHPQIELVIDTVHRQVGLPVDNVDLAVRMARAPWPDLVSTRLFGERLVPVCAPSFLARHEIHSLQDVAGLPQLHVSAATEDWAAWMAAVGLDPHDARPTLTFDTIHMAADAAEAGLGVAIGRLPLIDRQLREGRLVHAVPDIVDATTGYWLVEGPDAANRREVSAFAQWLIGCSIPE
ncbi:MAG TPA: transcriptional regulator GcvA [Devosiaceae bacterium]